MSVEAPPGTAPAGASFGGFVAGHARAGRLVVQPRMGFGAPDAMRRGLLAVRAARATAAGTITLDSYTRVGAHDRAARALATGADLNGYPLVAHPEETTAAVVAGIAGEGFPVQVRHGSALPSAIVRTALRCGLSAAEGGPVSYCLPYSRVPLAEAVEDWRRSCELLARTPDAHLESFGGCMLGQLCPPSLLVALSVLEGLFFRQHGLRSVSLSYAQQTHHGQDAEAVAALRLLAGEFLGDLDRHIVLYTYMGVFPETARGAGALLEESVRLAVATGAERLILKTRAEASRIPTIEDNIVALEQAHAAALRFRGSAPPPPSPERTRETDVYREARALVDNVLDLSGDVGKAFQMAFSRGHLDVPYCLHADNRNRARTFLDGAGRLRWASVGSMPLKASPRESGNGREPLPESMELLRMLNWVRERFDNAAAGPPN
ncbi:MULTISPECIES: methylaspartate mutase [Actinomadura]|uniref:Methylaspartate mutase n=1 Tax=Actinomadura yumaensis TaxID=111807 RepID=A0ABW2D118_9ACTN|nr:methylaspartate mutase [Actinomadura sp. J1-007]MWK38915.1 methylaspartate mutase [Actinomadura sp. J1-007]